MAFPLREARIASFATFVKTLKTPLLNVLSIPYFPSVMLSPDATTPSHPSIFHVRFSYHPENSTNPYYRVSAAETTVEELTAFEVAWGLPGAKDIARREWEDEGVSTTPPTLGPACGPLQHGIVRIQFSATFCPGDGSERTMSYVWSLFMRGVWSLSGIDSGNEGLEWAEPLRGLLRGLDGEGHLKVWQNAKEFSKDRAWLGRAGEMFKVLEEERREEWCQHTRGSTSVGGWICGPRPYFILWGKPDSGPSSHSPNSNLVHGKYKPSQVSIGK